MSRFRHGLPAMAFLGCALLLIIPARAHAGDELEHRHLVYTVARTIGFTPDEAELLSAASWSMVNNGCTDALPTEEEKRELAEAALTSGEVPTGFANDGYYVRGFLFH